MKEPLIRSKPCQQVGSRHSYYQLFPGDRFQLEGLVKQFIFHVQGSWSLLLFLEYLCNSFPVWAGVGSSSLNGDATTSKHNLWSWGLHAGLCGLGGFTDGIPGAHFKTKVCLGPFCKRVTLHAGWPKEQAPWWVLFYTCQCIISNFKVFLKSFHLLICG